MKKTFFTIILLVAAISFASAQDIIKGLSYTVSLVPKSMKTPNIKFKDGSGISLKYDAESGIHVLMNKNGKQYDFCEPFFNTKLVQVGEVDIDKDGRLEIIVASRSSSSTIEIKVFKKAEFEILYKEWSDFTGVSAVEFPGNGTVKLYDQTGNAGIYTFSDDGKLSESQ
ncbi:MAG TPA: hypothetical protein VE978_28045 [Chitinophagales bacterium]|nr:hypothetical protein [Chitinophagales bacterium]